jgi:hypothetical protein
MLQNSPFSRHSVAQTTRIGLVVLGIDRSCSIVVNMIAAVGERCRRGPMRNESREDQ